MPNVTAGDLRSKASVLEGDLRVLSADLPVLVQGTEELLLHLEIAFPEGMTNAQARAAIRGQTFSVRWNVTG